MAIQDLIDLLSSQHMVLLVLFCAIPLAAFLGGLIQGDGSCKQSKIKYFYAVLIYISCIPGMFSAVLTGYSVFFLKTDFLKLNLLVYLLPLVSMVATLMIIKKKNSFDDIPGFQRIWGLMLMLGISFVAAFLVYRTIVIIGFIGRLMSLLVVALGVFLLVKFAANKIKKGR